MDGCEGETRGHWDTGGGAASDVTVHRHIPDGCALRPLRPPGNSRAHATAGARPLLHRLLPGVLEAQG